MSHLVADYHTDSTIVDGIISVDVEKWRLKDSCREADFIGGRIIVCVDSLRSHSPFALVGLLSEFAEVVSYIPRICGAEVVIIAELRIYGQA